MEIKLLVSVTIDDDVTTDEAISTFRFIIEEGIAMDSDASEEMREIGMSVDDVKVLGETQ